MIYGFNKERFIFINAGNKFLFIAQWLVLSAGLDNNIQDLIFNMESQV